MATPLRTNSIQVITLLRAHILSHFGRDCGWDTDDAVANLSDQIKHMTYPGHNNVQAAHDLVMGGTFLIYYADAADFLDSLGINAAGKAYKEEDSWDLYVHLLTREIMQMVEAE